MIGVVRQLAARQLIVGLSGVVRRGVLHFTVGETEERKLGRREMFSFASHLGEGGSTLFVTLPLALYSGWHDQQGYRLSRVSEVG